MKKTLLVLPFLTVLLLSASSIHQMMVVNTVPTLPTTPFDYNDYNLPNHFNNNGLNNSDNTPVDNPVTDAGATLGRVLFYDVNMSIDNTISCASCHLQENSFTDPNALSTGVNGTTPRNSMSLANGKYYTRESFFWDERAATLEDQVLMPIQDAVEMGMTLPALVTKLDGLTYYDDLFTDAFGDATITSDRISKALSQFIRSMVSYQSKWDVGRAMFGGGPPPAPADPFPNFTTEENNGKAIFAADCGNCHGGTVQAMPNPRNNGVDLSPATSDNGVGAITGNQDNGKFKVGSLRNVAVTGPYMHDGRFATLADVVDFYSTGIQAHPNLHNNLESSPGVPIQFNYTTQEKADLVAFMETLTDNTFLTDERFSDPFATALAVEFLSFNLEDAQENGILLKWTVASDLETDYYGLEHSFDGHTFTEVEQIRAYQSSSREEYIYLHQASLVGTNFYRIKEISVDGEIMYSDIKSITRNRVGVPMFSAYPTTTETYLTIDFENELVENTNLSVFNTSGQLIFQTTVNATESVLRLNTSSWQAGFYFILATTNTEQFSKRIIKI